MFAGMEVWMLAITALVVFLAAIIRGYAGFGFAAMAVAGLSIFLPPTSVVPAVLLAEIGAGLTLLPSVWRQTDWFQLRWILLGALIATPIGLALLATLSSFTMRLVISSVIMLAATLIWLGVRIRNGGQRRSIVTAGVVSGLANGSAGIGGMPLVVFFLSKDEETARARATVVTYALLLDIYTCALAAGEGLITGEVLELALLILLPVGLGTLVGSRQFARRPPESFRKFTLALLMLISGGGMFRALNQP